MNERKRDLVLALVIDALLQLDPKDRAEVVHNVKRNGIFCVECGTGSDDKPNGNCQCWNED